MKKNKSGFYGGGAFRGNGDAATDKKNFSNSDEVAEAVKGYAGMSEEDLLDELFAEAAAARRRGDLDDKKLIDFYDNVKGMLDPVQLKKLDVLMRALKSDKRR